MRYKYRPINRYGLRIDEMNKCVNVSINGHGIVTNKIKACRFVQTPLNIMHIFGNQEGPQGKEKLPEVKAMAIKYRYGGYNALYDATAFKLKAYSCKSDKAIWKEIRGKKNETGFSLDINKTFYNVTHPFYTWQWSKKDMFDPKKRDKTYYSFVKIEYLTDLLYYQIAFGINTHLKGNPILVKIDSSGNEKVLKRLITRPEAHEDYGISEINKEDLLCKYFWVEIKKPELGSTYKIIWQIKDDKGVINNAG